MSIEFKFDKFLKKPLFHQQSCENFKTFILYSKPVPIIFNADIFGISEWTV